MNFKQTVELILLEKKSKKKSKKKRVVKKFSNVNGVLARGWGYGGIWDGCCDTDGGGDGGGE